jgi:hypothetical protein
MHRVVLYCISLHWVSFVLGFFVYDNGTIIMWKEEGLDIQRELPTIE